MGICKHLCAFVCTVRFHIKRDTEDEKIERKRVKKNRKEKNRKKI